MFGGSLTDKRFMKPIKVEYYVTKDMGEDTLREAVKRSGRDPATIKKFKMLGDMQNGIDYVSSDHFQACLKASDDIIRALRQECAERQEYQKTIDDLRKVNTELTAQLTAKKSRQTRSLG